VVKILPTKKGCWHELSNHKEFACHETQKVLVIKTISIFKDHSST
jgi:hypothetical protein